MMDVDQKAKEVSKQIYKKPSTNPSQPNRKCEIFSCSEHQKCCQEEPLLLEERQLCKSSMNSKMLTNQLEHL